MSVTSSDDAALARHQPQPTGRVGVGWLPPASSDLTWAQGATAVVPPRAAGAVTSTACGSRCASAPGVLCAPPAASGRDVGVNGQKSLGSCGPAGGAQARGQAPPPTHAQPQQQRAKQEQQQEQQEQHPWVVS